MKPERIGTMTAPAPRDAWPRWPSGTGVAAEAGPAAGAAAATESLRKHLSFLNHDLNNNLCGINLHLELLRVRLAAMPQFAEELATLDWARQSIAHTTRGMQRLLAHEQLRRPGRHHRHGAVHLRPLADVVAAQYACRAKEKGLDLSVEVPADAVACGEGDLIVLVLQNLVCNSVKYSSRGTVRLRARQHAFGPPPAERWVLSVSDEGQGIAPQHLARIFHAFERGDGNAADGVGLGLAIASEAAGLLGAGLSVESQVGAGTTFRMILDLPKTVPPDPVNAVIQPPPTPRPYLLSSGDGGHDATLAINDQPERN